MYALFFEDTLETAGVFHSKTQVVIVGRLLSLERQRPLIGIFNRPDGTTAVCCKFADGEQIFDGGCCPAVWPADCAPPPVMPDEENQPQRSGA